MKLPKELTDWADRGLDDLFTATLSPTVETREQLQRLLYGALELGIIWGANKGNPDATYDAERAARADVVMQVHEGGEIRIIKNRFGTREQSVLETSGWHFVYLVDADKGRR